MPRFLLCPLNYFDVVDQKYSYITRESAVHRVKARSRKKGLMPAFVETSVTRVGTGASPVRRAQLDSPTTAALA
ncbi:MAG: hypothetical protein ACLPHP_01900 [Candidatus Sulfotelmatobacter sp.]